MNSSFQSSYEHITYTPDDGLPTDTEYPSQIISIDVRQSSHVKSPIVERHI